VQADQPNGQSELSDDPNVLRQTIRELSRRIQEQQREIEALTHRLDALLRKTFGPKAESVSEEQLRLAFADAIRDSQDPVPIPLESVADEFLGKPPEPATIKRRHKHGRGRLPADLTRVRIEHPLSEAERVCPDCGHLREKIGEEITEQLDYVPASLLVNEHVRFKYACKDCQEHVAIAPVPSQPIEKGLPGPGLLAQVLVGKYCDHLPLHRQSGIFLRHGLRIPPSTLGDWVEAGADLFEPLVLEMKRSVLQSAVVQTDDTPVPVLDRARKHTRTGRLWVYVGDARHPYTIFDYSPDRSGKHPQAFLEGFRGYLQADAFPGYDALYKPDPVSGDIRIIEVGCMAHCRRKFYDAQNSDVVRSLATVAYIRLLYEVEKRARGLDPPQRQALREQEARPWIEKLEIWLRAQQKDALPRSPFGEAAQYALTNWKALTRYLEDGRLEIDNNAAERAVRGVALGRNAWTFAGSDEGGRRTAVIYSIVESARRHALEPFAYMRDLLARIPDHSQLRLAELLPGRWQPLADR
jgi:transposase